MSYTHDVAGWEDAAESPSPDVLSSDVLCPDVVSRREEPVVELDPSLVSRRYWRQADPELLKRIGRHNERIGSRFQRAIMCVVLIYVLGPIFFVMLRLLLRIRVSGIAHVDRVKGSVILASQHFYEWDPFVTFVAMWTRTILRPSLLPYLFAGHFWVKTPVRRAASYVFGCIGVKRGVGPDVALRRALQLVRGRCPSTIGFFPTGPVGRSKNFEVKPGIGFLAARCPNVPILPITIRGLSELRLRSVLLLRRPVITFDFGAPIFGRELAGGQEERISTMCKRLEHLYRLPRHEVPLREPLEIDATTR